jgi:hypothetical protein
MGTTEGYYWEGGTEQNENFCIIFILAPYGRGRLLKTLPGFSRIYFSSCLPFNLFKSFIPALVFYLFNSIRNKINYTLPGAIPPARISPILNNAF